MIFKCSLPIKGRRHRSHSPSMSQSDSDSENDDFTLRNGTGKKRNAKSQIDSYRGKSPKKRMKRAEKRSAKKRSSSSSSSSRNSDYDRPKPRANKRSRLSSSRNSDYDRPKPRAKKRSRSSSSRKSNSDLPKSRAKKRKSTPNKRSRKTKRYASASSKKFKKAQTGLCRKNGVKWNFLQHKGPVFAPPYQKLPKHVKFRYNGKPMELSRKAEEVAGFYSKYIEKNYANNRTFNKNFFSDWKKTMTAKERRTIKYLDLCDFTQIHDYYKRKSEKLSIQEKRKIKEKNEAINKEFGTCIFDGHKEKVGNFRIEPPGLFLGRGDHPKKGMLKARINPEDVIINCSKGSKIPKPPKGHKWKEVRHDKTVSWLACWTDNIRGQIKYIMLNPSSKLKGQNDFNKYQLARELGKKIEEIRQNYRKDLKSKELKIRQIAVAMYFIDKLALRAGNEKDRDQADTVGCCNLRYEHIKLFNRKAGKKFVVQFDFLGKDSIRYQNEVSVDKCVYKNLKDFLHDKEDGDNLFDTISTQILNKHLNDLMKGLTAKVFRTYNASYTLQQQLNEFTPKRGTVTEKLVAYNKAIRAVAILCNHKRAAPKSHEKIIDKLHKNIQEQTSAIKKLEKELNKIIDKVSKKFEPRRVKLERDLKQREDKLSKLESKLKDKEIGKEIAMGTSKLNYLDPRITVAWCKKYRVPIEKAYNKTQRAKFQWAFDKVGQSPSVAYWETLMNMEDYDYFWDDPNSSSMNPNPDPWEILFEDPNPPDGGMVFSGGMMESQPTSPVQMINQVDSEVLEETGDIVYSNLIPIDVNAFFQEHPNSSIEVFIPESYEGSYYFQMYDNQDQTIKMEEQPIPISLLQDNSVRVLSQELPSASYVPQELSEIYTPSVPEINPVVQDLAGFIDQQDVIFPTTSQATVPVGQWNQIPETKLNFRPEETDINLLPNSLLGTDQIQGNPSASKEVLNPNEEAYLKFRKQNTLNTRRSREQKKIREAEMKQKLLQLETEHAELQLQLNEAKKEQEELKSLLASINYA